MKTKLKLTQLFLSIVFCLAGAATMIYGQETTGKIEGFVKDAAGAVVPNVTITVTDAKVAASGTTTTGTGTGFRRTITTSSEGFSVFCRFRPELTMS